METADAPFWAPEVQGTGALFASGVRNLRDVGFDLRTIVQRTCHGAGDRGGGWCRASSRDILAHIMPGPDSSLERRRVASPPPTDPQTRAEALSVAARALRAAEHVCVLSGAGVSAESGIPTFRDALTGHWATFSPQELATREAFAANPGRVWQWYAARRSMVRAAQPNASHQALVFVSAVRIEECCALKHAVNQGQS